VILLDILLPDLDGLSICEILHSQPSTREIPVFMISALNQSYAFTRNHKASFDLFFTKPVDFAILGSSIRRVIEARQDSLASKLQE
jgi:CheY-like chemotaxis protein